MAARVQPVAWEYNGVQRTGVIQPSAAPPSLLPRLALLLHGHGAPNGASFLRTMAAALPPDVAACAPDGLLLPEPDGVSRRGWGYPAGVDLFGREQDPMADAEAIGALLRGPLAAYRRVAVVGYSQGGALTGLLSYQITGGQVVAFGFIGAIPTPRTVALGLSPVQVPVFVRVGDRDSRVPVAEAQAAIARFRSERPEVDAEILPRVTHKQAPRAAIPALRAWLARVLA